MTGEATAVLAPPWPRHKSSTASTVSPETVPSLPANSWSTSGRQAGGKVERATLAPSFTRARSLAPVVTLNSSWMITSETRSFLGERWKAGSAHSPGPGGQLAPVMDPQEEGEGSRLHRPLRLLAVHAVGGGDGPVGPHLVIEGLLKVAQKLQKWEGCRAKENHIFFRPVLQSSGCRGGPHHARR